MLIAINKHIINKDGEAAKYYYRNYEPFDLTIPELVERVVGRGYAFCPHVKDNYRDGPNFIVSGYLAIDIDGSMTIQQAMAIPICRNYATFIYTTQSHTDQEHRFRIVFVLEVPLTDRQRMEAALAGLIHLFKADTRCKDAVHLYFGSKNAKYWTFDKKMPESVVDDLIIVGREANAATHSLSSKGFVTVKHSESVIRRDQLFQINGGGMDYLDNIPDGTEVHCHVHGDDHASAIVGVTQDNYKCVFCVICKALYFIEGSSFAPYNFDYGWEREFSRQDNAMIEAVIRHKLAPDLRYFETGQNGYLATVLNPQPFNSQRQFSPNLIHLSQPFLTPGFALRHPKFADDFLYDSAKGIRMSTALQLREQGSDYREDTLLDTVLEEVAAHRWLRSDGVTYIKSPKGSGKTTLLKFVVDYYKTLDPRKPNIILFGHRRSLLGALAELLGLTSYLKGVDGKRESFNDPTAYYAICLDSMPARLKPHRDKYDIVIIDEVEQVFSHLLSSTLKDRRGNVLALLQHYLKKAKHVLVLDADLSQLTMGVMSSLAENWPDRHEFAVINTYKAAGRSVLMYNYPRQDQIVGAIIQAMEKGKRCYVCTNSRALAKKLHDGLVNAFPHASSILITSENSNAPDGQHFIRNITTEILNYDLIVSSPSLGTGIDITFAEKTCLVDAVFGIFSTRITTHFDMDQQICRVRNPGEVHVWIGDQEYISQTDPKMIRREIDVSPTGTFVNYQGFTDDGIPKGNPIDELHKNIYAAVSQVRRASMNKLRKNFKALKESDGWTVTPAKVDAKVAKQGAALLKQVEKESAASHTDGLLSAPKISHDEHGRLLHADSKSRQEKYALERYRVEKFFHQELSEELVAALRKGRLITEVENYRLIMDADGSAQGRSDGVTSWDRDEDRLARLAMVDIFTAAGVWKNTGGFDLDAIVEMDGLGSFLDACRRHERLLWDRFGVKIRREVKFNPTQQLGTTLKVFGLGLEKTNRDQSNNGNTVFYRINKGKFQNLERWYRQHMDEVADDAWRRGRIILMTAGKKMDSDFEE